MARLAHTLGRAVDAAVGIFSPGRQAQRAQERARAQAFDTYSRYAAGQMNAQYKGFGLGTAADRDPNLLIRDKSPLLRARVRQLVRDFPLFARILDASVNLTVGKGFAFQYRVPTPDGKGFEKEFGDKVETAWWHWCQAADAAGRLTFADMERLARRQEIECGEALAIMPLDMTASGAVPLRVQLYEPDWLTGFGGRPAPAEVEIIQGLEVNTRSGRVLAYWFENPLRPLEPQRVDAADVVHTFETLRPGQLRGVSPLVSAVLTASDLGNFVGAEVEGAMMAARYLAKIKTNDPAKYMMGRTGDSATQPRTRVQEIGHNILEIMRPGEDLEFTHHDRPGSNFENAFNAIARMICVTSNLSFELVTGNYSGINFSNLKGIRGDLIMLNAPTQARFSRQWHQRIFNRWLDAAHLSRALDLPGYWSLREHYQSCATWQPPGVEGADVLRETKSLLDKMRAGLVPPQDLIMREGRDPQEVLQAIAAFQAMAKELGVKIDWGSTGAKTNPAALGAGDDSGLGDGNAEAQ